ncbi:glucose-methanol-choline oxidoreductase, partial [Infundibulicybe gibba]
NHNAVTAIALKAHPSSRGTVRLTGSHPQDRLDIQKQRFQAERGPQDVADMREAIKRARGIMANPAVAAFVDQEVFPGPQAQTDEQIEDHIYQNAYGHHACCTNSMGPDHDGDAVLDGDFRVRGANNLRVVDASSWPAVPGYFITTPIYMISEKAADVIIAAAIAS